MLTFDEPTDLELCCCLERGRHEEHVEIDHDLCSFDDAALFDRQSEEGKVCGSTTHNLGSRRLKRRINVTIVTRPGAPRLLGESGRKSDQDRPRLAAQRLPNRSEHLLVR